MLRALGCSMKISPKRDIMCLAGYMARIHDVWYNGLFPANRWLNVAVLALYDARRSGSPETVKSPAMDSS